MQSSKEWCCQCVKKKKKNIFFSSATSTGKGECRLGGLGQLQQAAGSGLNEGRGKVHARGGKIAGSRDACLPRTRSHACTRVIALHSVAGASGCCSSKNDNMWVEISRLSAGKILYFEGVSRCHFVT